MGLGWQYSNIGKWTEEPMRPLVSALQGRLVDTFFGFKKVEEVMNSYTDIRSGIDTWFERLYTKVLRLSELVGLAEMRPPVNRRGYHSNRNGG